MSPGSRPLVIGAADWIVRMSRGMNVSAEITTMSAAAANSVDGTPIAALSGPATSAPMGIAHTEPRVS